LVKLEDKIKKAEVEKKVTPQKINLRLEEFYSIFSIVISTIKSKYENSILQKVYNFSNCFSEILK
jgi:hypothetical protein